MKKILFLSFIVLLLFIPYSSSAKVKCPDACRHQPPPTGPGGDHADDNYSYSEENDNRFYFVTPGIIIYQKGYYKVYQNPHIGERENAFTDLDTTADALLNSGKILVLPGGSLMGKENDSTLKAILKEYVRQGGTVIALGQQYGVHTDSVLPVPEGESLKIYGWREDQSCYKYSVFFEDMHPVLSSQTNQRITAGIDGYIADYPSNSTILLKRRTNHNPAMLYYPYGMGKVIITALYTDWAYGRSQATTSELNIIRDLITFAKKPDLPIPMHNIAENGTPAIQLNVNVENSTEETTSKVILKVYTPDRKQVIFETTASTALNPGDESAVPVDFTLPVVNEYGIYHTDFELYDSEDNLIQPGTESPGGRFALYRVSKKYNPHPTYSVWVTAKKDTFHWNEPADLELHVKNYTDQPFTMDWYHDWTHEGHYSLPAITVPASGEIHYPVQLDIPQRGYRSRMLEMFWLWTRVSENSTYRAVLKGINVKYPRTLTNIKVNPSAIKIGDPINYSISTRNPGSKALENVEFKVFLEQRQWPDYAYTPIAVVFETTRTIGAYRTFNHNGTYTHPDPLPAGMYRLRSEITRPDGNKNSARTSFSFIKSHIQINTQPLTIPGSTTFADKYLEINENYAMKVYIRNLIPFYHTGVNVSNGKCTFIFAAESGEEAYRGEVNGIALSRSASRYVPYNFTFTPPVMGRYFATVIYEDETGTRIETTGQHDYTFKNDFDMTLTKHSYSYGEPIGVNITARGTGTFKLKVDCPAEAFSQEQTITLSPENNNTFNQLLEIPTSLANSWTRISTITVTMENTDPTCSGELCRIVKGYTFNRTAIKADGTGTFGQLNARLGSPIDFNLNFTPISGFTVPMPGQLKLSCARLNYQDVKTVSLNPIGGNPFTYQIPVPSTVDAGKYSFQAVLTVDGHTLFSDLFPIEIPQPLIISPAIPATAAVGDTITLQFKDSGGKDGIFDIAVKLYDEKGYAVKDHHQVSPIPAGGDLQFPITIPASLKGGKYSFYTNAKENQADKSWSNYSGITITGLSAQLNAYTLKEKYFDNENVSGKAEITAGAADIDNATLRARIIRHLESRSGTHEDKPGSYLSYNIIRGGYSKGDKLYLSTYKGLLEYHKATGSTTVLHQFGNAPRDIYVTDSGEIWVGTNEDGVFHRDNADVWQQFTSSTGLQDNQVNHILEADFNGTPSIWVANRGGIAVFSSGTWNSLTSAQGLPSDRVYALAKDETGAVWASTMLGVVRFNGTTFQGVSAPFGTSNVYVNLTATPDGSVWMVYSNTLYRYRAGTWDQWSRTELYPDATISIQQIETVGNDLWLKARFMVGRSTRNLLIRNDGDFTVFINTEIHGLTGLYTIPIIPGNGDDAYFICEFGFTAYNGGTWSDKKIAMETEKLANEILSMDVDSNGNIWAGTYSSLSMYDGHKWINYPSTSGNQVVRGVYDLCIDTSDRVYGYTSDGVIKFSNGVLEKIDFTSQLWDLGFYYFDDTKIAVDGTGRVWLGRSYTFYYDGDWHKFEGIRYVASMENDPVNGIWVGSRNTSDGFHLLHIKDDLTLDDYSAANSDILPGAKDRLYMDQDGVLWFSNGTQHYLQSFDGQNWVNYSGYEGFPEDGVFDFVKDGNGKLVVMDIYLSLHVLEDDRFVPGIEELNYNHSLVSSNGQLHFVGGEPIYVPEDDEGGGEILETPNHLVTLSAGIGLAEKEVWRQTYNPNLSAGGNTDYDLLPARNLPAGSYQLKTALISSLGQELAVRNHAFSVRESDISVVISGGTNDSPYIKAGSSFSAVVEILNNTTGDFPNLTYVLKKQSPSGTVETLKNLTLNVPAGDSYTDTVTFSESTTGTWRLTAELSESNSGGEPGGTTLSQYEMLLQVTEPAITAEVLSPQYAGDEAFDVKVKLVNEAMISSVIDVLWTVAESGEDKLRETVTLVPGEQRVLTFSDTTGTDRNYKLTLSGDVNREETHTIQYGYKENFTISVLPSYREGTVAFSYQISNSGGLAFRDDIHFELYTVGAAAPLYTIDKTYNLYAAGTRNDNLDFSLVPGNYRLTYRTTKNPTPQEALFTVQPAGTGVIAFTGGSRYPVGLNDVKYTVSNSDSAAGSIPVTVTISDNQSQPVFSETRYYYLEPGVSADDAVHLEFSQKGSYTLTVTGPKLTGPLNSTLRVLDLKDVSADLTVGTPDKGDIPVTVTITNNGYSDFTGTAVLEVDGKVHEEQLLALSETQITRTIRFDTDALSHGAKQVNAYLYDAEGNALVEKSAAMDITPADIKVTAVPQNLEFDAGSYAEASMTLRNEGHQPGECILNVTAFDTLSQEQTILLAPGEEIEINDIMIDAPADLPSGSYPLQYTLTGTGVTNGQLAGNFNFKVKGISLDVAASFSADYYNVGETAQLTLTATSQSPTDTPLEVLVNWGEYSEKQTFDLSSGSRQLVFNIPVDQQREEKVFYGIYHEGGKGIHLNDIYLRIGGETNMVLGKQVYQPGDIVSTVFTGGEAGVLTASSMDETHTVNVSDSTSLTFAVPDNTLGGSYGVTWEFTPSDPAHAPQSGVVRFDVSGLVVKVAKSELGTGKYAPGDTIKARYTFESNKNETLTLRCWTTSPTGEWKLLGESSTVLSAEQQVNALTSYSFNSDEAGTHHLVYGLYRQEQLAVSGSMAFDVGDAVSMGMSTGQYEYKEGNETVDVKIDYFGQGSPQLELFLDDQAVDQRTLTIDGIGSTVVSLSSDRVVGGPHTLKAVLTSGGLTSTKTTDFLYGTHLPDLTLYLAEAQNDGLDYTYGVQVSNRGKTASAAASLSFTDNGDMVETVSIPALQPGAFHEAIFTWSGSGKAGAHDLVFEADSSAAVKEYSETNNHTTFSQEVPDFFYSLNAEPGIWPADSDVTIVTRLLNNRADARSLTLDLTVANNVDGGIIFQRTQVREIPAFGGQTVTDIFNVGVHPAGQYTVSLKLTGTDVDIVEEKAAVIEATKAVTASSALQPAAITADTDTQVRLTMDLQNSGNVPIEEDAIIIEVHNMASGEIVKTEEIIVSIPWKGQKTETRLLVLNLPEGNYEIGLKYLEELIASADLQVKAGLKVSKTVAVHPRVLLMKLSPVASHNSAGFITNLLQSHGIRFETGKKLLDSLLKLHKGYANITVAMGNLTGPNLCKEIKERVWSGEGLIVVRDKPLNGKPWRDFLGVQVKNIPAKNREKNIRLLPSGLSGEGDILLQDKTRLHLVKEQEDVVIIAETLNKKHPVITYRQYGSGHILVIALPLEFRQGAEAVSQLLLNAVSLFSKDIYSQSKLTRLLPIGITIENKSLSARSVVLKELLPYEARGYDFEPEPVEGDGLKWELTVPPVSEVRVSYWLALPDQVDGFGIKSEIYEGEVLREEASLTFDVTRTVSSCLDELVTELESLEVTGPDARYLKKAVDCLQRVRGRVGDNLFHLNAGLLDTVNAGAHLSEVKTVDVAYLRVKTAAVMRIMGRILYERIKQ
ncbi:MAG: hypothetical protein GY950_18080 [bacterium]|nr:hypothetical protein [bacterium]